MDIDELRNWPAYNECMAFFSKSRKITRLCKSEKWLCTVCTQKSRPVTSHSSTRLQAMQCRSSSPTDYQEETSATKAIAIRHYPANQCKTHGNSAACHTTSASLRSLLTCHLTGGEQNLANCHCVNHASYWHVPRVAFRSAFEASL